MQRTETTLGRRPRCGALDKAYDAFHVYAYFHEAGGFAAVPWADRADHRKRFSPDGLPLCAAGLPMPRKSTFWQRSHCLISHEKARYGCPFSGEGDPASACPIHHPNAAKEEGCVTTLPTRIGNRVRHELDRENVDFARIYNQRSACERINSQALALGIERPHLRKGRSSRTAPATPPSTHFPAYAGMIALDCTTVPAAATATGHFLPPRQFVPSISLGLCFVPASSSERVAEFCKVISL